MININLKCESKYEKFLLNCKEKGVILFGASNYGKIVCAQLKKRKIDIDAFCDNDSSKWGTTLDGISIISIEELKKENREKNIMITSNYFNSIYTQLSDLGFYNIMYRNLDFERKLFYNKPIIELNMEKINEAYDSLADEKSKETMLGIINHRLTNDFTYIIHEDNQYFVEDIMKISNEEIFVDGGAYIGDTIEEFIGRCNKKFKKIYAFEPDSKNAEKLRKFIAENNFDDRVIIEEAGLHDKTGIMKFNYVSETGSCISEKGTESIQTKKIDDYFKNIPVTFIKMDIEGSEKEALNGAEKTIKINKPKLAICIYHEPNDLWEIPLMIKKIMPEYRIYIRHHREDLYETVCYAI